MLDLNIGLTPHQTPSGGSPGPPQSPGAGFPSPLSQHADPGSQATDIAAAEPPAAAAAPPKRRRRNGPAKARKVKLYAAPDRTTIPSTEFRAAIASGNYSSALPTLQVVVASAGLPPPVVDDESLGELLRWRKIPLLEEADPALRAFILATTPEDSDVPASGTDAGAHAFTTLCRRCGIS